MKNEWNELYFWIVVFYTDTTLCPGQSQAEPLYCALAKTFVVSLQMLTPLLILNIHLSYIFVAFI